MLRMHCSARLSAHHAILSNISTIRFSSLLQLNDEENGITDHQTRNMN